MHSIRPWKRVFALLAFSLIAEAFAATVSLVPAEPQAFDPANGISSPIAHFASGFLDALYAEGYIVTDSQVHRMPSGDWDAFMPDLGEARDGYVDFLVLVYVDWKVSAFQKDALLVSSLRFRVVRVSDGKILGSGSSPACVDSAELALDTGKTAANYAKSAASPAIKLLATLGGGE